MNARKSVALSLGALGATTVALATVAPVFAHDNTVALSVACHSGQQVITATVTNDYNLTETVTLVSETSGVSFGVFPLAVTKSSDSTHHGVATLTATVAGSRTGSVTLTVNGLWSDRYSRHDTGSVTLPGGCVQSTPTPTPAPTATPTPRPTATPTPAPTATPTPAPTATPTPAPTATPTPAPTATPTPAPTATPTPTPKPTASVDPVTVTTTTTTSSTTSSAAGEQAEANSNPTVTTTPSTGADLPLLPAGALLLGGAVVLALTASRRRTR